MQKILHPDIVMLYYLMEKRFIQVLNMLNFPVCVTCLTKVSNFQSCHVCQIAAVNVLVFPPLMHKSILTKMWNLHFLL